MHPAMACVLQITTKYSAWMSDLQLRNFRPNSREYIPVLSILLARHLLARRPTQLY